jgi:hypothetical protein
MTVGFPQWGANQSHSFDHSLSAIYPEPASRVASGVRCRLLVSDWRFPSTQPSSHPRRAAFTHNIAGACQC